MLLWAAKCTVRVLSFLSEDVACTVRVLPFLSEDVACTVRVLSFLSEDVACTVRVPSFLSEDVVFTVARCLLMCCQSTNNLGFHLPSASSGVT